MRNYIDVSRPCINTKRGTASFTSSSASMAVVVVATHELSYASGEFLERLVLLIP